MIVWRDCVVPVAMELGTFDVDGGHVCIRHDNAAGILAGVEFAAHGEAGFGCGGRDQFDDDPVADERLGAPVLTDEGVNRPGIGGDRFDQITQPWGVGP